MPRLVLPLLCTFALGCPGGEPTGTYIAGELEGERFEPATVVFDLFGPAPEDSAAPEPPMLGLVLTDAPEACPLLGPLFHYAWLRCESACEGLLAQEALWPEGELRALWLIATAEEEIEADYALAGTTAPGRFTATYRAVELSRLAGMDQVGCYEACVADYAFLMVDQGAANLGELTVDGVTDDLLEGELDLLFPQGEVEGRFAAPVCGMGLHAP